MSLLRSALASSALILGGLILSAIPTGSRPAAAAVEGLPDPGEVYPMWTSYVTGNRRTLENLNRDVDQHPTAMVIVFGRLTPKMTFLEVLPTDNYWTELVGMSLQTGAGRGRFIQVADSTDKAQWDALATEKSFVKSQYKVNVDLLPLNLDSLAEPGSVDMVLSSKKLATFMRAGTLDKYLTAAYKSLKPGGTFLVEDYRAAADKPQDMKAASGYIREDFAVAQIQKAGFKLADKDDKLLANPNDARTQIASNSDRFLLKFTK